MMNSTASLLAKHPDEQEGHLEQAPISTDISSAAARNSGARLHLLQPAFPFKRIETYEAFAGAK